MLVLVFVPPDAHELELAGVFEVLFEANQRLAPERRYAMRTVGVQAGLVRGASGLQVLVEDGIASAPVPADTLIIVGAFSIPPNPPQPAIAWLRERAAEARRYGAVCTGAFVLGAAGLLEGRRVTTHWQYADELASRFPGATVEPDRIFIRDGPMFTSAGSSAAIDLTLALLEEDHGRELALWVARRLVMFLKRPGGQSQFSVQLAAQTATRSPVQRVQQMVRDNPARPYTVKQLAGAAAMSPRNFSRVFSREAGMSPADFVELTRIEMARRLLEETDMPIQRAMLLSGFGSAAAGRRAFLRRLGLSPSEYGERFRSTGGRSPPRPPNSD